jgi:hypothetical protein
MLTGSKKIDRKIRYGPVLDEASVIPAKAGMTP